MKLFLGIDAGTQSMKAMVIDAQAGAVVATEHVHYGKELPDFRSPDGFCLQDKDTGVCYANPIMWAKALELLMEKLEHSGIPLKDIAGISGSGQQHGSVYLKKNLGQLSDEMAPSALLTGMLSRSTAPIWMDHSTEDICAEYDRHFGTRLQELTGSPAIPRFTGPQIRKFFLEQPEAYAQTTKIHLVSSFLCSLLIGKDAPVDVGDAAGMNLLDLNSLTWAQDVLDFTAPNLREKLPDCVPSHTIAGTLSPYFQKYGFSPNTPVLVFSGDNPNSLVGVGASQPGMAVISLGTSDTVFATMTRYQRDPEGYGHIFGNPAGGFMSLICFSNGSLAREKVKDQLNLSWDFFDVQACADTQPGNDGRLMLPYFSPESTPQISTPKVSMNFKPEDATPAQKVRCILESQALAMRLHSQWIEGGHFRKIRVTGGASRSRAFRQILADVFQADVESIEMVDSAASGAALRAAQALDNIPWQQLFNQFCKVSEVVRPHPEVAQTYQNMLDDYASMEAQAMKAIP